MWKLLLPLLTVFGAFSVEGNPLCLRYYDGRHFSEYRDIPVDDCRLLLHNLLNNGCKNATIFIPRFQPDLQSKSVKTIVEAYLLRETESILAFNYLLEPTPFHVVIPQLPDYAASLASAVECLVDARIRPHLIGYGVGAHLAGLTGKILKDHGKILPRITGLDPAGLLFPSEYTLRGEYAEMVDVIHTDLGYLGNEALMGTVDFFPNAGMASQPGCFEENNLAQIENVTAYLEDQFIQHPTVVPSLTFCSHQRSYQIYAESILNPDSFLCVKKFGKPGSSSTGDTTAYMGLATPPSATGLYAVTTKATCPFGNSHNPISQRELDVLCNQNLH